jgi:hypothetical protein
MSCEGGALAAVTEEILKHWLRQCRLDEPLEMQDPRYVDLNRLEIGGRIVHPRGEDWIDPVFNCITRDTLPTCQLFSGFYGTGKSTELRRLKHKLEEQDYTVIMVDVERYHDLEHRLAIEDLIIILAGAFGDAAEELLGRRIGQKNYWERFLDFLQTRIELKEISLKGVINLKAAVQHGTADFWTRIREKLSAGLADIIQDAHQYIATCIDAIQAQYAMMLGEDIDDTAHGGFELITGAA